MFDKIGKGKNRQKLLALVKEDFPDLPIPEVDAAKPVYDELSKFREEFEAEKAAWRKEKADREEEETKRSATRSIAESRRALREQGWDDEGIEKIETLMRETGNPHYESAAQFIKSQMPASPDNMPANFTGQGWNWFKPDEGDDDQKLLAQGPKGARQFQDRVVSRWIRDMRQQKGRAA